MSFKDSKLLGHIASFLAYTIFGFNIILTKDLMGSGAASPLALFTMRAIGAALCFWTLSLFAPAEKVEKHDLPRIALASFTGYFLTQVTFLKGITLATPLDCSIISTLSPVFTMLVAALVLKEPLTVKKAGGVLLGLAGIILLILNSVTVKRTGAAETTPYGIVLLVLNSLSFATYLGAFRPLIRKYNVVTFMKWIFLFAIIMTLPFTAGEIVTLDYASIPGKCWWELAYLIVMATFVAYYLVPLGQQRLRPTVVSLYSYLQPMIATIMGIALGMDRMTWTKAACFAMVIAGAVLVNRSKAKAQV